MARYHAPKPRPDMTAVVADTLEAVCLEGARRMLAAVLAAEVDAFLERPRYAPGGRATGYRNGYAREREIGIGAWRQLNGGATLMTLLLTSAKSQDGILVEHPARRQPEVPMAA